MNDKLLHALVGYVIASTLILSGIAWIIALIVVIIFAIGKEIYDQWKYKGFDYKDLIATLLGGVVYIIIEICK